MADHGRQVSSNSDLVTKPDGRYLCRTVRRGTNTVNPRVPGEELTGLVRGADRYVGALPIWQMSRCVQDAAFRRTVSVPDPCRFPVMSADGHLACEPVAVSVPDPCRFPVMSADGHLACEPVAVSVPDPCRFRPSPALPPHPPIHPLTCPATRRPDGAVTAPRMQPADPRVPRMRLGTMRHVMAVPDGRMRHFAPT